MIIHAENYRSNLFPLNLLETSSPYASVASTSGPNSKDGNTCCPGYGMYVLMVFFNITANKTAWSYGLGRLHFGSQQEFEKTYLLFQARGSSAKKASRSVLCPKRDYQNARPLLSMPLARWEWARLHQSRNVHGYCWTIRWTVCDQLCHRQVWIFW